MPLKDIETRRAAGRAATRRWYRRNKERTAPARRKRDRERYAANRELVLSAKRERYSSDRDFAERTRASNAAWYQRNRDKRREYNLRYRQEHGDELRARERERDRRKYAKNPRAQLDYYKQWRLRNLDRARAYVRVAGNKRRVRGRHALHIRGVAEAVATSRWSLRVLRLGRPNRSRPPHPALSRRVKRDQ
jgi:hypothetical protein